jgi:opacity protein-like surface antigen
MVLRKSILIIPLLIISLSCIAHSQPIYKWVDEQGNIHFTTKYENVPPKYRNQVGKPEGVEEVDPIKEMPLKPEKPAEVEKAREIQPKEEIISPPDISPRGVVDNPNYVTFKGGIYSPESDDLEDFDTGFNVEIAFGHYFHRNLALELGVGYFETEATFSGFDPILFGSWREEDEITAIPLTLTAKGVLPLRNVDIFAAAGIGLYFVHGEADISTSAFGSFSFDDDDTVFGFHLGLGGNFNITENIFLGIEGKYLWAEAEFEESVFGVPIELDADLEGFTVTGNIGFRF